MRWRTAKLERLSRLAALALLAAALHTHAPAQSGRIIPKPTPTPEAEPLKKEEAPPAFVPDPTAEKYRLVFTRRREGKFGYSVREVQERLRARRSAFDNFVEGLNKAGERGYRVVTLLKGDPAVVALGAAQYEYAWTESGGPAPYIKVGFSGAYLKLAKVGFRLAAHELLFGYCINAESVWTIGEQCEYRDFFLFERRKGAETPGEHEYVRSDPGGAWRKGPPHEEILTAGVREKQREGFYPARLLSKFELLTEREPPDPALAEAGAELQVARSSSFWERDELPKRVNELARQGYRLSLVDNEIALMYRRAGEAAAPASYVWLNASKKGFEKELAALQASGAIFRATYPDRNGTRNALVFEQGPSAAPREYRVLRFTLHSRAVAAEQTIVTDFAPASADAERELNRLAREGFVVLALFDPENYKRTKLGPAREEVYSEEYCILLERRR